MDRIEGTKESFTPTCLYLDKDKGLSITTDKIDLPSMRWTIVTIEDFKTAPLELSSCSPLSPGSKR
jgi:hypothetical protein